MIIGGISLYRSFAMYEEKATFNVLKGTVPDFASGDITLAFTIDGTSQNNKTFPNKGDGYIVENVNCEDGVKANWNNSRWSLENIQNEGEAKKVKCTVAFKTLNQESGLNGAEPVLGEGMIPVVIKDNGKVIKTTEDSKDWYDYDAKQWANAVILTEAAKTNEYVDNAEISETDIESYFVWIPKFSYQLFDKNMGKYVGTASLDTNKQNQAINIKFGLINTDDSVKGECSTPMNEEGIQGLSGESWRCDVGEWMTHPAFLAFGGNGFWVGKFEVGYNQGNINDTSKWTQQGAETDAVDVTKIIIKPDVYAWRYISVGNSFKNAINYQINLNSHLMKNTEWGAVAYLTQSIYGRCESENKCTEITTNSHKNYKTGYVNGTTTYFSGSTDASTTGNYSGIYDMSGGSWEQMASVMADGSGKPLLTSSLPELTDLKYYDLYSSNAKITQWDQRILGDAIGEVGPFDMANSRYRSSMFQDHAQFVETSKPWFVRGGHHDSNYCYPGIFAFMSFQFDGAVYNSFRIVLAI